jgi:hypothetical protein
MYYLILFFSVITFLTLVAWRQPERQRQAFVRRGLPGQGTGQSALAMAAGCDWTQLMKGERKEDQPCLTPVDCVRTRKCSGHCGWR